ncbi:permease-like cell division protein FtsX [Candidatus Woesebacteria bacterium]|nr:permease-like cell division protein FtsX [Candidatus Woesebacteria bacterium]
MNSITTALATIRRSPYQALTSIIMVSVTFFVAFSFSLFVFGASKVLQHFETRPQIIAFFKLETPIADIKAVAEKIKSKDYVESASVISQEDALKLYQEENKSDPLLLELVTADILPASVEVSGKSIESLEKIKTDLNEFDQVEDIRFQEDVVLTLSKWVKTAEIIGLTSIIVLSSISFLIIMTITAMKASAQKKSITIMRLLGATKGYIKAPFMIEGMIYGLIGSVIGWISTFSALLYLTPVINEALGEIKLLPIPIEFYLMHASIGIILGFILGGFASLVAVQRLIKN